MVKKTEFKDVFVFGTIMLLAAFWAISGSVLAAQGDPNSGGLAKYRTYALKHISADAGRKYIDDLKLGTVSRLQGTNTLLLTGYQNELVKASAILKLVDSEKQYTVKEITPTLEANNLPSAEKIAAAMGAGTVIGTFANPPLEGVNKAIMDVCGKSVILIAPADIMEKLTSTIAEIKKSFEAVPAEPNKPADPNILVEPNQTTVAIEKPSLSEANTPADELFGKLVETLNKAEKPVAGPNEPNLAVKAEKASPAATPPTVTETPKVVKAAEANESVTVKLPRGEEAMTTEPNKAAAPSFTSRHFEPETLSIPGESLGFQIDLPDKTNITSLIELVGKNLKLNLIYNPAVVTGDVTLRVQNPVKMKDLYPLLESVLKFKGFVMSRRNDNIITVVPAANASEIDPRLIDGAEVRVGDVVITHVFVLKYINTTNAKNLLDNMKLGSNNIVTIPETKTLIVTEFAYRMERIEKLLNLIDRPGELKQFRYRQLKYTMAASLAPKVKALAEQLGTITITIAATTPEAAKPTGGPGRIARPTTPALLRQHRRLNLKNPQCIWIRTSEQTEF